MAMFAYVGQNAGTGKKVKASIEAETLKDAKLKLRKQNIYVIDISLDTKSNVSNSKSGFSLKRLTRQPPKVEDVSMATKQFAILMRSAVDMSEALKAISEQVENVELRAIYGKIRESVSEGKSLSDAHREFPKVFPPLYANMIGAAEKAGALPLVLRRLSDFMTWQIAIKRKVIGALTYPAIMIVVAFGVTIFLFVNVLPKITKAFSSLKVTLPWYTILLNKISAWMQQYWIFTVVFIVVGFVLFFAWKKTEKGRRKIDYFMFTAPAFGPLIQRVAVSQFAKTLSTVLSSGVRIVEGLTLTRDVVDNAVLEDAINDAIKRVQDGEKLASALEKSGKFPIMVIHMLRTGEKTGKLEEMLTNVAEAYDEEVDYKISSVTKLIEPVMMIFMAGLVMLIVMSVLGPMMQAMSSLK